MQEPETEGGFWWKASRKTPTLDISYVGGKEWSVIVDNDQAVVVYLERFLALGDPGPSGSATWIMSAESLTKELFGDDPRLVFETNFRRGRDLTDP